MAANETGHEKNIANFKALITYLESIGDKYKPSKASLKLLALQQQYDEIKKASDELSKAQTPYYTAVDAQEGAFDPLDKLLTRVIKNLRASVDTDAEAETAESLRKKIAGSNRKSKKKPEMPPVAGETPDQTHSTSQRSYDNRSKNLKDLILTLKAIPAYAPGEDELKVENLETISDVIEEKVQSVNKFEALLQNTRIARDKSLYADKTGALTIVGDVKEYVGAVFGAGSPELKFINRLTFKNR